ncbi:DUF4179 domain-containing protein [Metabacillus litoralis]|uniref:DUF4179 domain-containing protein n=1 Tax=Metabacillus litoralis TaxID=152268 RepID=UPI001B947987|nr:DUF4179 domain-containing protein [Metabacillus litoralis]MCM3409662.1 DUF4179 domain-containing protein [Metabacillus litoralis]UHA58769.1 DUF4179 domain-containing protein [Metabacillus litoralis]
MKDIYELLNDIDIDENEFEEMEVSEFEKARVKKTLKKSLNQKKKMKGWKRNISAAAMIVGLSASAFGLTFPAYAGNIPVIGDIFRFLDNGRTGLYDNYKEYSTEVNMTEESKGISVTINDAIYDGKTVSVTYSIESDRDLGNDPYIFGDLDIKGSTGQAGSSTISKLDENHYVGLITASSMNLKNEDKVKVNLNIESITNQEKEEEIKGNWSFALSLDATESNTKNLSDHSVEANGVQVNVGEISITPMSFIVYYEQIVSEKIRNTWHGVDVEIQVKDDLGNRYSGEGNGGSGDSDGYNISWSKTFEKLDEKASKLIITPHITLREYTSENFGAVEITESGEHREIPIPKKPGKGKEEFVLDDIVIELGS